MHDLIVSYLDNDVTQTAQAIVNALTNKFGASAVADGVASVISPGEDFEDAITEAIDQCEGLLIVIGSNWASATDWSDEMNYDRVAIIHALNNKKKIIPILIDDAKIPSDLPEDMAKLSRRVGLTIESSNTHPGIEQIVQTASKFISSEKPAPVKDSPAPAKPQAYKETDTDQGVKQAAPKPQQTYPPPQKTRQPAQNPYGQQQRPPTNPYGQQQTPPANPYGQQQPGTNPYGTPYGNSSQIDFGSFIGIGIVSAIAFALYYFLSLDFFIYSAESFAVYAAVDGFLLFIAMLVLGNMIKSKFEVSGSAVQLAAFGAAAVSAIGIILSQDATDTDGITWLTRIALGVVVAFAYSELFPSNQPYHDKLTSL